jgi:hypothetical protein
MKMIIIIKPALAACAGFVLLAALSAASSTPLRLRPQATSLGSPDRSDDIPRVT